MSALLLWPIVFASRVAGAAMSGYPSCPCITYEEGANDTTGHSASINASAAEELSYGIGCSKHDSTAPFFLPECNNINGPGYCSDAWCYVDKNCSVHRSPAAVRLGRYFSYGTCGYVGRYNNLTDGKPLNVIFLTNSGGWMGSYCKEGFPTCDGPVADILNYVLAATGAKINVIARFHAGSSRRRTIHGVFSSKVLEALGRDLPNETRASWPCWYATGMGYVDLCIYAGTSKSARLAITPSLPLYSEPMYLITSEFVPANTVWELLGSAFIPFTVQTWAAVIAFIMLLSNVLAWQEHCHGGTFSNMPWVYAFGHASYLGFRSLVDQAVTFEPRHLGGRLTSLALGFFLLVTIAAYTANLAADLILKPDPGLVVESWAALLRDPANKVCTKDSVADHLQKAPWNLPAAQAVRFQTRAAVFPGLDSGVCVAAVASQEDFVKAKENGGFCKLARVGQPLYYAVRAAPVSRRAAGLLQYHLAKAHESGQWKNALSKWEVAPKPCAQPDLEMTSMKIEQMLGPFILSSVLGILGVIATLTSPRALKASAGALESVSGVDILSTGTGTPSPSVDAATYSASCKEPHIEKTESTRCEDNLSMSEREDIDRDISRISLEKRCEEERISERSPEESREEPRHHLEISREELHELMELQQKLSNSLEGALQESSLQKSAIRGWGHLQKSAPHPWLKSVEGESKELDQHGRQASRQLRPVAADAADFSPGVIIHVERV